MHCCIRHKLSFIACVPLDDVNPILDCFVCWQNPKHAAHMNWKTIKSKWCKAHNCFTMYVLHCIYIGIRIDCYILCAMFCSHFRKLLNYSCRKIDSHFIYLIMVDWMCSTKINIWICVCTYKSKSDCRHAIHWEILCEHVPDN